MCKANVVLFKDWNGSQVGGPGEVVFNMGVFISRLKSGGNIQSIKLLLLK